LQAAPQYVVNVQNNNSQEQGQSQHVSMKQKVVHTAQAVEGFLSRNALLSCVVAFALPKLLQHLQGKRKCRGLTLNVGFGGF